MRRSSSEKRRRRWWCRRERNHERRKCRKTYPACIRRITETNRYEVFFDDQNEPPSAAHPQIGVCRHCGGAVHEQPSRFVCVNATGENPTCGFALKKLWCERPITTDEAVQLLTEGRTGLLEGFRSKKNRPFKATISVGPEGRATFEFADKAGLAKNMGKTALLRTER